MPAAAFTQQMLACQLTLAIRINRIGIIGFNVRSIQPTIKNKICTYVQNPFVYLPCNGTQTPYRSSVDLMCEFSFALGAIYICISCAVYNNLPGIESLS